MKKEILLEDDYLQTSDLTLASALSCLNYPVETIDKQNPSKAIFMIKRQEGLDETVRKIWAHQIEIDPLLFASHLKQIKSRLYNS